MEPLFEIVVALGRDGKVRVKARPAEILADKVICLGALEVAKDAIREFAAKQATAGPGLVLPDGHMPNLRGVNGK